MRTMGVISRNADKLLVHVQLGKLFLSTWRAQPHCWETVQITDGLAVCVNFI